MALVLADRVRDTTTTTGTGTVTLSGTAPTGYQNFSVVGDGNTTYYTISGGSQWETGIGTYSSTGPTLTRTTVLASSNSGSLVNFSAGTKDVFVTYPAEKSVNYDDNGQVVIGVGGASDTALLDVEGNIYAASAIRAGGGIDLPSGFGNYWRASLPSGAYQGGLTYNGGLRFYSGDVVSERMRIDTSGNVGVGTTTMAGRFNVTGATTNLLYGVSSTNNAALKLVANSDVNTICNVQNSGGNLLLGSNGTGERMRIDTSGNVGIGTTAPSNQLSVGGNTSATISFDWTGDSAAKAWISTNFSSGEVRYAAVTNYFPTFYSNNSERMRIDLSGNLGLGTSSPTFRLTAANSSTDGGWLYSSGTVSILGLGGYSGATDGAFSLRYDRSTGVVAFNGGTRDTPSERMRLTSGGDLLIGTTTADQKLTVNGAVAATSYVVPATFGTANFGYSSGNAYITMYNSTGSGGVTNTITFSTGGSERMRLSSGVLTVGGANVAIGFQSTGQQVISATTALGASNLGTNILVVTGGITLTLPTSAASGKVVSISNISGSNITLSYTGSAGTDGPTTLAAQTSLMLVSDGGSPPFWRAFFPSGGFDGSTLFQTGYKLIPQNQRTGAYTLALTDIGKHIYATAGSFAITVPANASVAFPVGTAITIVCEDAVKTVSPAGGVALVLAGTGAATTGTRTLAIGSVATLIKVQTDRWYISGSGVT